MDNAENEDLVIFDPIDNAPGIAKGAAIHFGLGRQFLAFTKGERVPGYPVNDLIKGITDFHGI